MSRLIDNEPKVPDSERTPLKVVIAGLGRTGTTCKCPLVANFDNKSPQYIPFRFLLMDTTRYFLHSNLPVHKAMYFALKELGFSPFHGQEYPSNAKRWFQLWKEAMDCNFLEKGKPYGREEFDKLLRGYDAVMDFPPCLFWEDFYKAYPDVKIILTNRDPDSWLKSMQNTIFGFMQWRIWRVWRFVDRQQTKPMLDMLTTGFEVFCSNDYEQGARQAYIDHYERVRKTIPSDQLLEFNFGHGYEPLCRFLNVDVPQKPYPHQNTSETFNSLQEALWVSIQSALRRNMYLGLAILGLAVGIGYRCLLRI